MSGRLNAATRRRDAQKTRLSQINRQVAELSDQIRQMQAKAASLEHQAGDVEARTAKLRDQMNNVTSNKEYSALLVEVNTLKLERSKFEDEALAQMGQIDDASAQLNQLKARADEQTKLVTQAEAEMDQARAEVGTKLDELQRQRAAAAEQVPAEVLTAFERLADRFDGEALAPVQEENRRRREYTCGGCYMQLPIEWINALMTRPDELVNCPSCGRFLYIGEELKSAIGSK
jgi:hypothetical protein